MAFKIANLDQNDHLETLDSLRRPADLEFSAMDPSKILNELGWHSHCSIEEIVEKMFYETYF